jgi:hypothetical protein
MPPWIKARWEHLKQVARWWWAMVITAWTLLSLADFIMGKMSPDRKAVWDAMWITPKWGWKVWIIGLLVITVLMLFEGSYRLQHATIKAARLKQQELEAKLTPSLYIEEEPLLQTWTITPSGVPARSYYIGVKNTSVATTIEHVKARLTRIEPMVTNLEWLPIALHIKHDNPILFGDPTFTPAFEFTLNPGDMVHVDLVSAMQHSPTITVEHVVPNINKSMPPGRYKLTILVTGHNVPPVERLFEVFLDEDGMLQCNSVE